MLVSGSGAATSRDKALSSLSMSSSSRGGLRTVCRVRPPLAPELQTALRSHAGLAPVLRCIVWFGACGGA